MRRGGFEEEKGLNLGDLRKRKLYEKGLAT